MVRQALAALRGEDPRTQMRYMVPYAISGVYMSPDEALSLGAVWGCIDAISRNIASQRWNIYEPIKSTGRRRLLSDDYKTWMLNTRPNPEMTAIGFRESLLFQAIPYGNAYAEIVRDVGGRVIQLWPLRTDRVQPKRAENGELVYEFTHSDGQIDRLASAQILHIRGPGLFGLMGENIIARAAKTIGLAAAQERFSASFFGQGAQMSGVLEYQGKLGDEQYKRLKESWNEKAKGPENAHKPIILEGGMKFTALSVDPQKSQLVETRKFSVEDICRWFGVPPHKIQHLEHATFSNIEHSSIEFVRDALTPWERRICQEADAKLFDQNRGPWRYTEIDLRPLTYGDAQSRSTAQASWRQNGIMNANEIRAMEGLDDIGPEGDVYIVQSNMTTMELVLNPPKPPAPALPKGSPAEDSPAEDSPPVDPVKETAKAAIVGAFKMSLNRFNRRLVNRKKDLRGPPDKQREILAQFTEEQTGLMLEELQEFNGLFNIVFGTNLERKHVEFVLQRQTDVEVEEAVKQLT